ncbi:MAG TPA: hypothetical protein VLK65_13855 [Vicinamibacteria bacterium]|nr:hypothetical protein [Vicinamibacteria bacterium]
MNRNPQESALDLGKYVQHVLLLRAHENRAFAHIMVRRLTYFDPVTGVKVDEPDTTVHDVDRADPGAPRFCPKCSGVRWRRDFWV